MDSDDSVPVDFGIVCCRIEVQSQSWCANCHVIQNQVPDTICPTVLTNNRVIGGAIFDESLRDNPRLTGVTVECCSTMRRDTNLGRGVAAQDWPILNEHNTGAVPSGCYGGAEASQTSATDDDVICLFDGLHYVLSLFVQVCFKDKIGFLISGWRTPLVRLRGLR